MKLARTFNYCLIVLLMFGVTTPIFAEDYRIGVVNVMKVLEGAPQAEVARKALEKEFAARDRQLVADQKTVKQLQDRLGKDAAIMSESERSKLERDIVSRKRELKRDQDEFREDVNFRRNEEFGKIQRQIVEAIQKVAREDKYDLIVGEGVIYASGKVDLTPKVVDRLKVDFGGAGG